MGKIVIPMPKTLTIPQPNHGIVPKISYYTFPSKEIGSINDSSIVDSPMIFSIIIMLVGRIPFFSSFKIYINIIILKRFLSR